jgi:hypothetical protein
MLSFTEAAEGESKEVRPLNPHLILTSSSPRLHLILPSSSPNLVTGDRGDGSDRVSPCAIIYHSWINQAPEWPWSNRLRRDYHCDDSERPAIRTMQIKLCKLNPDPKLRSRCAIELVLPEATVRFYTGSELAWIHWMGLLAPLLDKDMQSDYFDGQAFRGYVDQGVERMDVSAPPSPPSPSSPSSARTQHPLNQIVSRDIADGPRWMV